MVATQTINLDARQATFNEVHGNQYNYHVQQLTTSAVQDTETTARLIVEWLYPLPFDAKHQYVSSKLRQPGTGLWLLEDQRMKDWLSTKGSFLWLHGIPGSGKTVLTSTVIDMIQARKSTTDDGFAFFYADFSELHTRQPKDILRSFFAQLVSSKPQLLQIEFGDLVKRMYNNHKPPSEVSELTGLIVKACDHYDDVTLVFDALDECVDREDFPPCFETLSRNGNIRILVTSRKEKDIRDMFRNHTVIALDGENRHIHADMEKHIRHELEHGHGFGKIPQRMKDIIISSLLERADGMFRWVQCQLDQIRSIRTNKKILEAVKNLPKGLFATYDRILQNIHEDDEDFAQKTLSWLLVSDRPLQLSEIVEAFAVDVNSRSLDRDATLNDAEDLLEICSSLIAYNEDNQVISFSHYSVQEYLLSSHLKSGPLSRYTITTYDSHRDLSRICLTYILLDSFDDQPCESRSDYDVRIRQYPFLEYAAGCWDLQAEKCPGADDVFELTMDFLCADTFQRNYNNYLQARHRSPTNYFSDKPPLSLLTNARLTWMLERISKTSPNWFNDELGRHGTPLVNAVFRTDIQMINFLIGAGADINKPTDLHVYVAGMTPLYLAAYHGLQESFEALLKHGADVDAIHTLTQSTPLHEACNQGLIREVKQLLDLGADVNRKNLQNLTPLHFAIQGRSLEVVKLLVEVGAEIDGGVDSGPGFIKTVFHYAIELQDAAITEYLLDNCEDLGYLRNLSLEQILWTEGKPWFERLRRAIHEGRTAPFWTATDVMKTKWILQERLKLPPVVTATILDYAEFWVRSAARRDDLVVVDQNTPDRPYVRVRISGWGGLSPVRRVVFRTRSHDQGFSDYPEHHGTYRSSCSWFDVGVKSQRSGVDIDRRRFQDNVHASWVSREHLNVWDVRDAHPALKNWFANLRCGDWLEVYAKAFYPGWQNYVESVEVEVYCAWLPTFE